MNVMGNDFFQPDVEFRGVVEEFARPRGPQAVRFLVTAFVAFGSITQAYASIETLPGDRLFVATVHAEQRIFQPATFPWLQAQTTPQATNYRKPDVLAGIEASEKAKRRALTVLKFGEANGMAPDRVAATGEGGIAMYWFSDRKLDDGASARFSMLTITKQRMSILLKDRVTRAASADIVRIPELPVFVSRLHAHVENA